MTTQTDLTLGIDDHDAPLSFDEFAGASFEEPWRYELVEGKRVVMSPNSDEHADSHEQFRDAFVVYKVSHRNRVDRVISEAWVSVDEETQRVADLAIYLKRPGPRERVPGIIPDLIVEIVSGGGADRKRDFVDKRAEYLRVGVKECVIVDRFRSRVIVHRRSRGRFVESELGPKDTFATPLLPGLKIPLNGII